MKGRSSSLPARASLRAHSESDRAFTLVELLLGMAILIILMLVLVSMVSQAGSLWRHTTAKIEEFREARDGFESVTRRLSQATLNTYWDYDNPNTPKKYLRQSELRFISGPKLLDTSDSQTPHPTHSLFFFGPLGFVRPTSATDTTADNYQGLANLLNLWGYFIEYSDDSALRPKFVPTPPRKRFRLMELMQPSQSLDLYSREQAAAANGNATYVTPEWFQTPTSASGSGTSGSGTSGSSASGSSASASAPRPVHVLAENIIALILLPKLSPADQKAGGYNDASLAPGYFYSSTGLDLAGSNKLKTASNPDLNPTNQLPPVMQVTMVAIDEASANRMTDKDNQDLQSTLQGLFLDPSNLSGDLTGKPKGPAGGQPLQDYLRDKHINYRTFTSDVSIRAAKWSSNQRN